MYKADCRRRVFFLAASAEFLSALLLLLPGLCTAHIYKRYTWGGVYACGCGVYTCGGVYTHTFVIYIPRLRTGEEFQLSPIVDAQEMTG